MFGTGPRDKITAPPTIAGTRALAWSIDLDALRRRLNVPAMADSTLVMWVIEAPWANLAWHSYALTLVHLRPFPGQKTIFYLDGATHELWLYALDPGAPRQALIEGAEPDAGRWWLTPINFASQIIEPDDGAALARVRSAVLKICEGHLSPDTDYNRHWIHLFGDNMIKDKANAGRTRVVLDLGGPNEQTILDIPPRPGPQDRH